MTVMRKSKSMMESLRGGARVACAVAVAALLAFPVPAASLAFAAEELGAGSAGGAESVAAGGSGGSADGAGAGAEAFSQVDGADADASAFDASAVDITEQWRAGSLNLDKAGTYVLTDDITAGGTLFISAPEGATITLDFNGHVVTVDSAARAIDVAASCGAVVITNSSPRYANEEQPQVADNLEACLVLKADDMTESLYGISYKTPDVSADGVASAEAAMSFAADANAESADASADNAGSVTEGDSAASGDEGAEAWSPAFSLTLEDVAVGVNATARTREALGYDAVAVFADTEGAREEANVTPRLTVRDSALRVQVEADLAEEFAVDDVTAAAREAGGVTCALYVGAGSAHIDGSFFAQATSEGEAWDLLGVEKDAFEFEEGCAVPEGLTVSEGGAVEDVAALVSEDSSGQRGADGDAGDEGIALQASGTDLNAAWEASGLSSSYAITQGGTYYLSTDLTTSTTLEINAPGEEVTLDFNGHGLTIRSLSSQGYGINIKAAKKVTLQGDGASSSKLFFNSAAINYAVSSVADELVVSGLTVQSRSHEDYVSLKDLFAASIYATTGSLSISNCNLVVDLSNQGNTTVSANNATTRGPMAIYVGSGVTSARVENTSVEVVNSPVVSVRDATSITGVGYAYGLYSLTSGSVEVSGCTFDVTSALGAAVGACGKNLTFTGATKIGLSASSQALGINSQGKGAVKLNGSLDVSYASSATEVRAALYSLTEDAFVLGSGFSGSNLGVWIGSGDTANDDGVRIATFDAAVDANSRTRLAGMLANAQGASAPCSVASDGSGAYFALQTSRAPVKLTHNGADTFFSSFAAAVDAATVGDTITLLADAGDLAIDKIGTNTLTFTVDLNGHSIESFKNSSSAKIELTSSVAGGEVSGVNADTGAAVAYSGTSSMVIRDITINSVSSTMKTCGVLVSGTGSLELDDVDIVSTSQRTEARGINQTSSSGGDITISGGSISAATTSMGVAAYGVTSSSTKGTLTIEDCPVDVQGTSATTGGIDVKGALALTGGTSETSLHVYVGGDSTNAWGIRVAANDVEAALVDASVVIEAVNDGTDARDAGTQYWCLSSSTSSADYTTTWALDGSCLLDSCTDTEIRHYGEPLSLGVDFESRSSSISVSSKGLESETFASLAQGATAAKQLAGVFEAAEGSVYADWGVGSQSLGELVSVLEWTHANVARNTSTGETYTSLATALGRAKNGETVQLTSNCTTYEPLSISTNVTLDLAGKTLSVDLVGSSAESTALEVSASGSVTVKGGTIKAHLGSTPETASSARSAYQGLAVTGGGTLAVSSCTVDVVYEGATTTEPKVTLYGASVNSGSLQLDGTTKLTVQAAPSDGAYGAQTVAGIYVSGTKAEDAVSVASSASVSVDNNAATINEGQIGYPEGNVTGTNAENNASLIELDVEEGNELDQEIQAQFLIDAQFDSKGDADGYVFGTQIYYASSMELPSGLVVWAYSDPVDEADAGKLSSIRATHVFVRSDYETPVDAYGIAVASGFAGSVEVSGTVKASTTSGHAYGVYRSTGGTWDVASSKVSATCGDESYRANMGDLNLADYIDVSAGDAKEVLYPDDASYTEVVTVSPIAANEVARGSEPAQQELGGATYEVLYKKLSSSVDVTFTNMKSVSGDAASDKTCTVAWGQTLIEAGVQMPTPSDYQVGDVTYRFVGWASSTSSSGDGVYDPQTLYAERAIDATMQGTTDGEVVLVASYVPVLEGQCLVTFKVDDELYAYAVDEGDSPSFAEAYSTSDVVVPSISVSEPSGYSFTFKGWATGSLDDFLMSDGVQVNAGVLPAVTADVTYTAQYAATASTMSVTFFYMRSSSSGYIYSGEAESNFNWESAQGDAVSAANKRVKVGDSFTQEGVTYTFLGWSTRVSDEEPLYTDTLPVLGSDGSYTDRATFYGIYESSEKTYTVLFYVDGELYASASNVAASKTLSAAFAASDNPVNPTSDADGVTFRGWNTDENATSYIYANMRTLGEIAEDDSDSIELYAIWRQPSSSGGDDDDNGGSAESEPVVTFYDSDRTTVIDTLAVNAGETVYQSTGEDPEPKGTKADLFVKWVDEDGNDFSPTETPVTASMKVYAVYYQDSDGGTGVLGGSGSGGSGGAAAPSTSTTNSKLSGSTTNSSLADAAKDSDGSEGSDGTGGLAGSAGGDDADGSGGDGLTTQASASADGTAENAETLAEASEDSANAAGLVLVIVAVLAAIGGVVWWFMSRRAAERREAAEDEAEEAAAAAAASGQMAAEGIRF